MSGPWFVGVDIGGTFTDVVLAGEQGRVHVRKVRTTPHDPVEGVIDGVATALADLDLVGGDIARVVHGTTLATNLILERSGARVAFATTAGFKDLIRVPRGGGAASTRTGTLMSYRQPESLVPPELTVEVPERVAADGSVLTGLDESAADAVAGRLVALRPESVAVCLLHSYANGVHERRLAAACRRLAPEIPVYVSSELSPAMREYGRAATTVVSAYVGPAMGRYLEKLGAALAERGVTCPVHVMESSGGVMPLARAAARAVSTVESGPAAGVVSTQALAGTLGTENLLSFDMGGTTAKCGVVRNGTAEKKYELFVGGTASWTGRHAGGFPIRTPVVDLAEVGAGGGSIAWLDEAGALRVGPRSAGADPGPACYDRGGAAPTVTDANLLLGYLDVDRFAGGTLQLRPDLAERAVARIAGPLGLTVGEAAAAIHDLVTANMATAVRMVTIERGLDPREFFLVAFGGSGPIHAAGIAASFGIRTVVFPPHAGVRSAVGLLGTDLSTDQVQTCLLSLEDGDPARLRAVFAELEARAAGELGDDGGSGDGAPVTVLRTADVRYQGQAHQLLVPVPDGELGADSLAAIAGAFAAAYRQRYGVDGQGAAEIVNCRVRLERRVARWEPSVLATLSAAPAEPVGSRRCRIAGSPVDVVTYDRDALIPGMHLAGPALLDGADSTVVVPAGSTARVDAAGNLVLSTDVSSADLPPTDAAPAAGDS